MLLYQCDKNLRSIALNASISNTFYEMKKIQKHTQLYSFCSPQAIFKLKTEACLFLCSCCHGKLDFFLFMKKKSLT